MASTKIHPHIETSHQGSNQPWPPTPPEIQYNPPFEPPFMKPLQEKPHIPLLEDTPGGEEFPV